MCVSKGAGGVRQSRDHESRMKEALFMVLTMKYVQSYRSTVLIITTLYFDLLDLRKVLLQYLLYFVLRPLSVW
jgi:hypothetical protein